MVWRLVIINLKMSFGNRFTEGALPTKFVATENEFMKTNNFLVSYLLHQSSIILVSLHTPTTDKLAAK
jgi:hypothetical protein